MLTKKDVQYIANLARIHLAQEELDKLTENLGSILGYVETLKELNVDSVEPTSHALPLQNVYRPDVIKPSFPPEVALNNAPQKHGQAFKVPQVIE